VGDRVIMKSRFLGPTCHSQGLTPCDACQKGDYCLCQKTCANKGPVGLGGGWGDGYTCHHSEVWRVPDGLTDDQATLVEPLACSVRAVLRRVPKPKERVLVIGCGMIGLGTIQALRALAPSAQVFAAARHPQQQKLATRWGATLVEGDLYRETERICGAEYYEGMFNNNTLLGGFDVIYDCVANQDTLGQSLRMCRAQGAVVMVGVNLSQSRIDLTPILMQEVDLIGAMAHGMERWQSETVSTFELTARLIEEGKLETDGLITHRFDLSRWKEAIAVAANKRSGSVKVVFDFNT
jgi:threonine dehydrogenase-like Zn-dependent dehydrogenase